MIFRRAWLPFLVYFVCLLAGLFTSIHLISGCAADRSAGPAAVQGEAEQARAQLDRFYRGREIFEMNCAVCHGDQGRGNGRAAEMMFPRPRDFASGQLRLTSTSKGLPSDEDLAWTIRHGMLPSPMPPWSDFSDETVKSLALVIRHLAVKGRAADLMAEDPDLPREKALSIAREIMASGPPVQLPPRPAQLDLERGRSFFQANCAVCHDADGRALNRLDLRDSIGQPIRPRNLTTGPYKGGFELEKIATRVLRGIPGTPMPSFKGISGPDLWSTAAYVQSLKVQEPPPTGPCPAHQ